MKILIVGLMMDTNLGEDIYPKCIQKMIGDIGEYDFLDLYGRTKRCEENTTLKKTNCLEKSQDVSFVITVLIKIIGKIGYWLRKQEIARHIIWTINPNNKKRLAKCYKEKIKGVNLVIFAGGGIIECSLNHDYYHHIDLLTKIADNNGISVVFNAVGRVVDCNNMFGWDIMKKALKRQCVKSITCRDGCEWLNQYCFDGRHFARVVPCSAICASEAFDIKQKHSNTIGIGLIRENIFSSYKKNFSEVQMLELYSDIVCLLFDKGYNVTLFTNGYSEDIAFGKKLVNRLSLINKSVDFLETPKNAEHLIEQIASFKGIITARLHSCIVAYSLDIPMVAISWTEKVKDFMVLIREPELAIDLENLRADYIVEVFEKKLSVAYNKSIRVELEETIYNEIAIIKSFAKKVCTII